MKKIITYIAAGALLLSFSQCKEAVPPTDTAAAASGTSIADRQVKVWDVAIQQVMDIADAMPEDKYNYRPHDSLMTFAEQLVHIGQSSVFITNAFLKDIPRPKVRQKISADSMNKTEVMAYVKEQLEKARTNMSGMTNDQLTNEEVTSFIGNKNVSTGRHDAGARPPNQPQSKGKPLPTYGKRYATKVEILLAEKLLHIKRGNEYRCLFFVGTYYLLSSNEFEIMNSAIQVQTNDV